MRPTFHFIIILFVVLLQAACNEPEIVEKHDPFKGMTKKERIDAMEDAMRRAGKKEQIQIEGYLKRHQIPAIKTSTGVEYVSAKEFS